MEGIGPSSQQETRKILGAQRVNGGSSTLGSATVAYDLKHGGSSVRTDSMPMMSRRQLEEIAEAVRGVPVWGCLPGSTAAEAGVRYGDIVLSVNGVDTPTIVEYLAARKLRSDGFTLRLFRAGEELTVFVAFRAPSDPMDALAQQIADGRYVAASDEAEDEPKPPPS